MSTNNEILRVRRHSRLGRTSSDSRRSVSSKLDSPSDSSPVPQRRRCGVPITAILVLTTVVSTAASAVGGLVLYTEGLNALEDTVEGIAKAETMVAGENLRRYYQDAEVAAVGYKAFLVKWQMMRTVEEFLSFADKYFYSRLVGQSRVQGYGLWVKPNMSARATDFYVLQTYWDPLSSPEAIAANNGSDKKYISARYNAGDSNCSEAPGPSHVCVRTVALSESGDRTQQALYNYPFPIPTDEVMLAREADLASWKFFRPFSWNSSDGTPYYYATRARFLNPMLADHPVLSGAVELQVFLITTHWSRDLTALQGSGTLFAVEMMYGLDGPVYASSDGGHTAQCADAREYLSTRCVATLRTFAKRVREAALALNATREG
eukprot:Hpha_TRINITY_DN32435_c0_g1::TRINITY_DN32435_c0_g1_i1::g.30790::m.30790